MGAAIVGAATWAIGNVASKKKEQAQNKANAELARKNSGKITLTTLKVEGFSILLATLIMLEDLWIPIKKATTGSLKVRIQEI